MRVEKHQAPDAPGCGSVLFLVGTGYDIGDEPGLESRACLGDLLGRLLYCVADHPGCRHNLVGSLQFQRKGTQIICQLRNRSGTHAAIRLLSVHENRAATIWMSFATSKRGLDVRQVAKTFRVEDSYKSERFGECSEPLIELVLKRTCRAFPLALQQHRVAGPELDPNVGNARPAATLRPGRCSIPAKHLRQRYVDTLLAYSLRIVLCRGQWVLTPGKG